MVKIIDAKKEFYNILKQSNIVDYENNTAQLFLHVLGCTKVELLTKQTITKEEYSEWDLFVCMDGANVRNLLRIFGEDKKGKVKKLLDYTSRGGDVADPWYTGNFEITYIDVLDGCVELLKTL